ncbi:hypothetical protein Ndes2437B_g00115 [Nannochloris sp. 'desiccata']|nr:hypothetical protein KSW81_002447 [Chlorella desiccata (nom. nud.)]
MKSTGATTPANKRARTESSSPIGVPPRSKNVSATGGAKATPPSTNKVANSKLGALHGYAILVLPNVGIKHLPARLKAWIPGVQRLGGKLIQSYPPEFEEEHASKSSQARIENKEQDEPDKKMDVTHIVVGPGGIKNLPYFLKKNSHPGTSDSDEDLAARDHAPFIVDHSWLEQTLLQGVPQVEGQHRPKSGPTKSEISTVLPGGGGASSTKVRGENSDKEEGQQQHMLRKHLPSATEVEHRRLWLGKNFHDACATMTLNELVLQNVYNIERSIQLENEPIALALAEMGGYERALNEDYFEHPEKVGEETINHRALRYFRAAAVVRACAFSLREYYFLARRRISSNTTIYLGSEDRDIEAEEEEENGDIRLPFVGKATRNQIKAIVETGTCDTLECFRNNLQVTDSRGKLRYDTVGAATRYAFFKLPGVGQKTARLWWDLGLRSYEDVLGAAKEGEALAPGGLNKLTVDQKFSLEHRDDLLEDTSEEEVQSMLSMVKDALKKVSHPAGWRVELVGGGRRASASHDADFLVTHPTLPIEDAVLALKDYLIDHGQLFSSEEGMCRVQHGLLPNHIQKLKDEHKKEASAAPGYQTLDKFDHIYGNCTVPATGRVKRIDIIICPAEEWGFAFLGWVGSRTFLRMQRNFAKDLGMFLNSHALFLKDVEGQQGDSYVVPQEKPPKLRDGSVGWPPGWSAERKVEKEEDVFQLLGTPYRPPSDRNCF